MTRPPSSGGGRRRRSTAHAKVLARLIRDLRRKRVSKSGARPESATDHRLIDGVFDSLEALLTYLAEEEKDTHLRDVRNFFLQPLDTYSPNDLAALWRKPANDVLEMLADTTLRGCNRDRQVCWSEVLSSTIAFNAIRPVTVERALGAEFEMVRSPLWRTVPVLIHVPRFIVDALGRESVMPATLAGRVEQVLLDTFGADALPPP